MWLSPTLYLFVLRDYCDTVYTVVFLHYRDSIGYGPRALKNSRSLFNNSWTIPVDYDPIVSQLSSECSESLLYTPMSFPCYLTQFFTNLFNYLIDLNPFDDSNGQSNI